MVSAMERLKSKIAVSSTGCWIWKGYVAPTGYGKFSFGGSARLAHRVAYELFIGEIPSGMQLDHLCRVRSCVNPSHLEAVTQKENLLRGETITARNAAKTHCPRGHGYSITNTYVGVNGQRLCRECARIHDRSRIRPESHKQYKHEWYLRKKQQTEEAW